jgi:hypothetical protein
MGRRGYGRHKLEGLAQVYTYTQRPAVWSWGTTQLPSPLGTLLAPPASPGASFPFSQPPPPRALKPDWLLGVLEAVGIRALRHMLTWQGGTSFCFLL